MAFITRRQLITAARNADRWDFNRQLDLKQIKTLPVGRYPIIDAFEHNHRRFEPCERHYRLVVEIKGHIVCVDVPPSFGVQLVCENLGLS